MKTIEKNLCLIFSFCFILSQALSAQIQTGEAQSVSSVEKQGKKMSLRPLFRQLEQPSVFTEVNTETGAVIRAPKGTVVTIPPNCFVTENGTPVSGVVKFELKEVFDRGSFVMANVPTTCDGRMLESGGSVFMDAFSGNERVRIAPGKEIEIRFPTGEPTTGMQEFRGEYDEEGEVKWVLPGTRAASGAAEPANKLQVDPQTLTFSDGQHELKAWLYTNLDKRTECCGEDQLSVTAFVDDEGRTYRARCSGLSSCYYKSVVDLMQHIHWDIEKMKGRDGKVTFTLMPEKFCGEGSLGGFGGEFAVVQADLGFQDYDPEWEQFENRLMDRQTASVEAGNIIRAAQLGWINCDRFYDVKEKVNVLVNLDGGREKEVAKVFLVFRDIRSVVDGRQITGDDFAIGNMPKGQKAYAVAISYRDDQPFLGISEVTIGDGTPQVRLAPVSVDQIKARMAAISGS